MTSGPQHCRARAASCSGNAGRHRASHRAMVRAAKAVHDSLSDGGLGPIDDHAQGSTLRRSGQRLRRARHGNGSCNSVRGKRRSGAPIPLCWIHLQCDWFDQGPAASLQNPDGQLLAVAVQLQTQHGRRGRVGGSVPDVSRTAVRDVAGPASAGGAMRGSRHWRWRSESHPISTPRCAARKDCSIAHQASRATAGLTKMLQDGSMPASVSAGGYGRACLSGSSARGPHSHGRTQTQARPACACAASAGASRRNSPMPGSSCNSSISWPAGQPPPATRHPGGQSRWMHIQRPRLRAPGHRRAHEGSASRPWPAARSSGIRLVAALILDRRADDPDHETFDGKRLAF